MRKFLKVLGVVILCILLLLFSLLLFVVLKSRSWEKEFIAGLNTQYLVDEDSALADALYEEIDSYILSWEDTDFITLSPRDVSRLVFGSVSEMVGDSGLSLTSIYVSPAVSNWTVCGRFELRDVSMVHIWTCVDVSKDSMQTAQLYLNDIQFNGFSASKIYPKLVVLANQGIADALVTANENGFVGRIFENIELMENELIVKGVLY